VSQREALNSWEKTEKKKKNNKTERLQKQQYLLPRMSYLCLFYNYVQRKIIKIKIKTASV
jgi:hypothetical protein